MTKARTTMVAMLVPVLAGCAAPREAPAPVVDARLSVRAPVARAESPKQPAPPAPTPRRSEDFYTVKRGDTLYSIALEHGADHRDLAQWNALDDPAVIVIGQLLRVTAPPSPVSPLGGAQVGPARIPMQPEARPIEAAPAISRPLATEQPSAAPPVSAPFVWPAKGKLLAEFAEPRRKGIDIDGKPGDPVVAAAAGRVTYTGTGIPGMGKLVVIKHNNGYITVYAHNRDILVKEQQQVARGEKIAELGSTDSDRPKLHFQIRRGAAAVDPLRYLPGS